MRLVGRDTEVSIASGFLQLSFMGWSFVKVFPQSLLSRKINFRAMGPSSSEKPQPVDEVTTGGRSSSHSRSIPGSGLSQQHSGSKKASGESAAVASNASGSMGRTSVDESSAAAAAGSTGAGNKEKDINFYFLCDFNNSFEILEDSALAATTTSAAATATPPSSQSTSTPSSSQSAAPTSPSAGAAAERKEKEKEKQEKEKERKMKQRRRGSFILHSAKKKSLEEEEEREEREMRTAGPCCLINAGYIRYRRRVILRVSLCVNSSPSSRATQWLV
jgi:hypothetical protein